MMEAPRARCRSAARSDVALASAPRSGKRSAKAPTLGSAIHIRDKKYFLPVLGTIPTFLKRIGVSTKGRVKSKPHPELHPGQLSQQVFFPNLGHFHLSCSLGEFSVGERASMTKVKPINSNAIGAQKFNSKRPPLNMTTVEALPNDAGIKA